jgi:hypothetical protein
VCLMFITEEQSGACGDGVFEEAWGDEEAYMDLEVCANDEDFGLVRMKLGLDPRIEWGPYRVGREDVGMDGDTYGDW